MSDTMFQLYTTMFNHADTLCFHVQSAIWNEVTERTVNDLTSAARTTLDLVSESRDVQADLLARLTAGLDGATDRINAYEDDLKVE